MHARRNHARQGMTLVEFALLMPVLLFLLLGVMESGNMFFSWLTVQKAAQESVRVAATGIGDEEGTRMTLIEDAAMERLDPLDGTKTVTVTSWPGMDASGPGIEGSAGGPCQVVEVKVAYLYAPLVPLLEPILPESMTLTSADRKVNEPWKPCE